MCGIFCYIYNKVSHTLKKDNETCLTLALSNRGPDLHSNKEIEISHEWAGHFAGYVLWMQGQAPTIQPISDNECKLLLWNGDVFDDKMENNYDCDTNTIFSKLRQHSNHVTEILSQICGPYAFIYWDNTSKCLWFGRDVFGRHSLLWCVDASSVLITSVGHKDYNVTEVPATGVFMIDFSQRSQVDVIHFFRWSHTSLTLLNPSLNFSIENHLAITHRVIGNGQVSWFGKEPLETELIIYKAFNKESLPSEVMDALLQVPEVAERVEGLLKMLLQSVKVRVLKQPQLCKQCLNKLSCDHSALAVLFSGGLDSTVLALLCDQFIPKNQPIDLFNVAFEKHSQNPSTFDVPDRKTGHSSLLELQKLTPHRHWNFVKIDVNQDELQSCRQSTICHLIHPLATVLDDSLGCALWFAARGQGTLNGHLYTSPSRVVILGMGADEQLGGYMRHRTTFKNNGWVALGKELCSDVDNISRRNLGRDNRIVCDHGRQARMPYLDENVINYVNALPPWHRCMLTPEMPPGRGDKLILRLVAWKLGLRSAATLPKRALQFGSRIANNKEKGTSICERLSLLSIPHP